MAINLIKLSIILYFIFASSLTIAQNKLEVYQRQVSENLSKSSTDELVWIRAFNNTYNKFCKSHETNKRYNLFSKVATKTIIDQLMDRGDLNALWQGKYGYRKAQLISLKKRIGNSEYCNCIYNHVIKGNSACLKQ